MCNDIKDPGTCHGPDNHMMQVLLLIFKKSRQEQLNGKLTFSGSQFKSVVHHGGEVKATEAGSGWSHDSHNQETG